MGLLNLLCRSREMREALKASRMRLYRVAYAWTHNAALADDLVQETLAKALKNAAQLRDPQAQNAWLFSILANCFRDHLRRQRPMEDVDELELPQDDNPETEHARTEIVHKVRRAIGGLPQGQRQVVTLVDLEGFSYVQVAQILGIPSGTVMSRLCRARAALRVVLSAELDATIDNHQGTIRRVK